MPKDSERPLTPKQRAFVREILREDDPPTQVDAYRAAYATDGKPRSQRTEAARLARRPHVARAIEDGRQAQERSIQAAARGRRRWVLERLAAEAESAESDAARVRALEVIGRASGLFEPETEAGGKMRSHATADDLRQELEARLGEALGVVEVSEVEQAVESAPAGADGSRRDSPRTSGRDSQQAGDPDASNG